MTYEIIFSPEAIEDFKMKLYQQEIQLKSHPREYHLIAEIVENKIPEICQIQAGVLQQV